MDRVWKPCPGCGHVWVWAAVLVVAGVRSFAMECPASGCGWSAVMPVNGSEDER